MSSKIPHPGLYRPPDLDKPRIPYTVGQTFTVRRHIPPAPFMSPYPNRRPPFPDNLQKLTQLEYCLSWHPLEGSTCDDVTFSFTITKEVRVCDGRGAQVVVVNGDLVAKIYDPLFYPPYENSSTRDDVMMVADYDYTREAAAYNELRGPLEGTIIPRYHGSWTCDITVDTPSGPRKRPVRLILMEFIGGVCMQDLDPNDLTEEERSNIMVKAIAAENAIAFHGVQHKDFAPRNVLCSGDLGSPDLRVTIIDFNVSVVPRLVYCQPPNDSHQLPVSPIKRWRRWRPQFGEEWLPPTREEFNKWLWKHWGGSPLYRPVGYGGEDVKAA
jgi:serine/threonine protein kinase